MRLRKTALTGIILLVLAFTIGTGTADNNNQTNVTDNDIAPYEGSLGPGNALYPLKLAFEELDESFTFNKSEKLGKKVAHARLRIAEAKAELRKKNNEAAERALERYGEKIKEAEGSISEFSEDDSGILHANEMIEKHQSVLKKLRDSHPDNKGLERAYDNSLELKEKFKEKIERKKQKKEDRDEFEEQLKIKAKITGNDTQVEVKIKFESNSTENFTIAKEIRNKLQLSTENINRLLKIEIGDEGKLKEKLEAEAEVKGNASRIEAEYLFPLKVKDRNLIIDGIYVKLNALTAGDILKVLEMNVKEERKENKEERKERKEIKKEERRENKENRRED